MGWAALDSNQRRPATPPQDRSVLLTWLTWTASRPNPATPRWSMDVRVTNHEVPKTASSRLHRSLRPSHLQLSQLNVPPVSGFVGKVRKQLIFPGPTDSLATIVGTSPGTLRVRAQTPGPTSYVFQSFQVLRLTPRQPKTAVHLCNVVQRPNHCLPTRPR